MRRVLALALTATFGVALLASPAGADDSPWRTGAPEVRTCYDITLKQGGAESLTEDPVDCRADHTGVVIRVAQLPSDVDWSSPEDDIASAANDACRASFGTWVGRRPVDVYRSQYSYLWFMPDAAQREDGARWISCVLTVREDTALGDLPFRLPEASAKLPDSVAKCATAKYEYTTCADAHVWRATHTFTVRGRPTERSVGAASQRICPRHVTSRSYLRTFWDSPGNGYVLACYTKTRR